MTENEHPHEMTRAEAAINTLRFLAVDMVEQAASGHPGAPMGQAPLAYLLWTRYLRFDPGAPGWPNRDRFVLSAGHASALLYGLLHLGGFALGLDELRRFRQLGSLTPGHPEHELTPGVETTTGPLGQGLANAVGMAIAERMLAARFNRPGCDLFDHRTFVIASDGDLMEGVASEACSLAGHLGLGKLVVFYDSNQITIDGSTELAFSEDVLLRFAAYGWHTQSVGDGNDLGALAAATDAAIAETARPSLVLVRTHIAFGSPGKQGTAEAHGAALGAAEVAATKENLGWPQSPTFLVPEEARAPFREAADRGRAEHAEWSARRDAWANDHPDAAAELERRLAGELPPGWDAALPTYPPGAPAVATRSASGAAINALAPRLPELVGGSADLAESNSTLIKGSPDFSASEPTGRNLRFGVREHAMASIANGMTLSAMLRPFVGTFLVFHDYMRPAVRLAALMRLPVVYVYTHDSILLGEDGPTHQPEAHLAALRAMPGMTVMRPADARETVAAWRVAVLNREGPTALVLTRQKLPVLDATAGGAAERGVARGGYVARHASGEPAAILIATGSEVSLALEAQALLERDGIPVRVVSLPSWELFARQPASYREEVLPSQLRRRLAIEAASPFGWERWVGDHGAVLGQGEYGASAPYQDLARHFGFTPENVVARVRALLAPESAA
ncbi:MAG TPA: transketolase [Thermoanaerobaculia bacterium]|nr:transketolase [Thermoanaerobaculia bacterium]